MPAPGETETPQAEIDRAVKSYFDKKEKVAAISKRLKVSRAAVYLWIEKAKKVDLARIKTAGMTPQNIEKAAKRDLALENEELRAENARLWEKVRTMMLKYGEL